MDLKIDNLWAFEIFGIEVWITRTIFNTWLIMLFLIAFAIFVRIRLCKFKEIPSGFQNAIEAAIEMFDRFFYQNIGDKLEPLGTWFFTVFTLILASNLSGLLGLRPPTADWATTFAFAISTFGLIHFLGIKYKKGSYIKGFFEPHPVFLPLNLIGELALPVSLSFRMFGNVLSGMILMTLFYSITPVFVRFVIPAFLHVYFDLFSGILQTYVFCILSLIFIRGAVD